MNTKKSMFVMATAAALVASVAWAAPVPAGKPVKKSPEWRALQDINGVSDMFANRSSSAPVCETTGFEALGACNFELGFVCGSAYAGFCPASGPTLASCTGNPAVDQDCCSNFPNALNGWWVVGINEFCGSPNVVNVNPSEGEQHLRFTHDPLGGSTPGCNGFADFACNPNALMGSVAVAPAAVGDVNYSYDIAMSTAPFGLLTGNLQHITIGDAATIGGIGGTSGIPLVLYHSYYGLLFVYDYDTLGYGFAGYLSGYGQYNNIRVEFEVCAGEVRYFVDGALTYTGSTVGGGDVWNRGTWRFDNIPGNDWDVDNIITERLGPCPQVCGDGVIDGTEECEAADDANCPGRCVAAGDPGECTCTRPHIDCNDPRPVVNGSNGPYLTDGGMYSYVADTAFTSVDTCGSDYDTVIFWDLSPDCSSFGGIVNDECNSLGAELGQAPGDPSASCYVVATPPFTSDEFPLDSCLCAPTTPGNTYTFLIVEYGGGVPALGGNTLINIRKKTACGAPIVGGACCRGLTGVCEDGVSANECNGEFDTYTDGKLCSSSSVPACEAVTGSCCNSAPGAGGACEVTTQANCNFTWTANGSCSTCAEVQGACCNALLGSCSQTLQAACNCGADCTWTEGAACNQVSCNPIQGACCEQTEQTASCTQTSQAGCNCENCTWTRETDCEDITCDPLFTPIPTVSEWGLVIMALLLLVGGKVYFGRRQTAIA